MKSAQIIQHGIPAGLLTELPDGTWRVSYLPSYSGPAMSLSLPRSSEPWIFSSFPPMFEGLLPEGPQLEALLRLHKIDRHDYYSQLMVVGGDLVGSLTFKKITESNNPTQPLEAIEGEQR